MLINKNNIQLTHSSDYEELSLKDESEVIFSFIIEASSPQKAKQALLAFDFDSFNIDEKKTGVYRADNPKISYFRYLETEKYLNIFDIRITPPRGCKKFKYKIIPWGNELVKEIRQLKITQLSSNDRPKRKVILKVDDLRFDESFSKFSRVIEICNEFKIPASIGVIGNTLENASKYQIEFIKNQLGENNIEIWHHSWSHKDLTLIPRYEIENEVTKTLDAFKKIFDQNLTIFGAPFNKVNDNVIEVAKSHNLDIIFETDFPRNITPELNKNGDGQPNLLAFIERFERTKDQEISQVQIHPGRWDDRGYNEFRSCIAYMIGAEINFTTVNNINQTE
ncbi:polysaccharide deacetylase family protein [Chromobacterium sp. IIBBL 290-4]|uniref:polysaccharide deacetylase family protein n=1 Tax=Chromobacterium sp. IIBBL 290-4 TaxID=2953890 RepID=UPI0020B8C845|nr:polysaccharide deacetylase family protein [Chromobacterium sp. IIBBL 290-4]UTH76250.1 polysaccharide deacetylase family protein [Chromobacterium sp. IIBBL 290-4]